MQLIPMASALLAFACVVGSDARSKRDAVTGDVSSEIMSLLHRAILFMGAALIGTAITGCTPDWHESKRYPSPDGKYVVVVTSELQAANDPEPWWQHISIYRTGEERQNQKGNLFFYSGKATPTVQWKGPQELQIDIPDVSYSFTGPIDSLVSREISITATLHKPQKKNP